MNSVIIVIIKEAVWLSGVRALDLKPGDPEFKSLSEHQLDLFQIVSGSTPWLHL